MSRPLKISSFCLLLCLCAYGFGTRKLRELTVRGDIDIPSASARHPYEDPPFFREKNMGDLASRFKSALDAKGYLLQDWKFVEDPNSRKGGAEVLNQSDKADICGFSVSTQVEQVDDQGKAVPGSARYDLDHPPTNRLLRSSILRLLRGAPPGKYRFFTFIAANSQNFHQNGQISAPLDWNEKVRNGARLPDLALLRRIPIHPTRSEHSKDFDTTLDVIFLVYEFERSPIDGTMTFRPEAEDIDAQLKNSGLWDELGLQETKRRPL